MRTRLLPFAATALSLPVSAGAAVITSTYGWTMSTAVPDNDSNGLVDVRTVPADISQIQLLTVTLETTGGWNGDLYAYLQHSTGFSVLLNRPGRTAALPAGSPSSGLDVTIADAGAQELHAIPAGAIPTGPVMGTWQPDGRAIDPGIVLDTGARTALLSSFTGLAPAGTWALYIADVSTGDQATLKSWSLTITGEAVPEPSAALLLGLGGVLASRHRRIRPC